MRKMRGNVENPADAASSVTCTIRFWADKLISRSSGQMKRQLQVLATRCAELCKVGSHAAAGSRAVPIGQSRFHGSVIIRADWGRIEG